MPPSETNQDPTGESVKSCTEQGKTFITCKDSPGKNIKNGNTDMNTQKAYLLTIKILIKANFGTVSSCKKDALESTVSDYFTQERLKEDVKEAV